MKMQLEKEVTNNKENKSNISTKNTDIATLQEQLDQEKKEKRDLITNVRLKDEERNQLTKKLENLNTEIRENLADYNRKKLEIEKQFERQITGNIIKLNNCINLLAVEIYYFFLITKLFYFRNYIGIN